MVNDHVSDCCRRQNTRAGFSVGPPANVGQGTVPAQDTPYAVVLKGANQQVWQNTTYETLPTGQMIPHIQQYTELATGLHYLKNGQWLDSKEEIDILPNGRQPRPTASIRFIFRATSIKARFNW